MRALEPPARRASAAHRIPLFPPAPRTRTEPPGGARRATCGAAPATSGTASAGRSGSFLHLPKTCRVYVERLHFEKELPVENSRKIVVHPLRRLWESPLWLERSVRAERIAAGEHGPDLGRRHGPVLPRLDLIWPHS